MCDVAVHKKRKVTAQMLERFDPTHTTVLRNAFAREMKRRFKELEKAIWQAIVVEDCFGLRPGLRLHQMGTPGHAAFAFATSEAKIAGFKKWMNAQIDAGILTVKDLNQVGTSVSGAWTNKYVYDSYQRGVIRARYELQKAGFGVPSIEQTGGIGISMGTPFHMDRLGVLYSRVFSELKGITQAMDSQISRVLTQGMMDGDNPRRLASKLISTINGARMGDLAITDTLGRFIPAERRAGMLARTEVIRAHHQATVQEYKNWGLAGVTVRAEWSAVGDSVTCEKCLSMQGRVFTLAEIQGMIPAHTHCRCIAIPTNKGLTEEATGKKGVSGEPVTWNPKISKPSPTTAYNTAFKAERDANLSRIASNKGMTVEALKAEINAKLLDEFKDTSAFIRAKSGVVNQILADGRFKSQFETFSSGGAYNIGGRTNVEQNLWGYSDKTKNAERMIYGMLEKQGVNKEYMPGSFYGDTIFELNPAIKTRSTFTMGDSLDTTMCGREARFVPKPLLEPDLDAMPLYADDKYEDLLEYARLSSNSYTELQFHGQVTTSDIIKAWYPKKYKVPPSIKKKFEQLGIEVGFY